MLCWNTCTMRAFTWFFGGVFQLFVIKGCLAAHVDVSPRYQLVLPDETVTFMCHVAVPIQYCRVEVPGKKVLNLNVQAPPTEGVKYSGTGLQSGQCGFTIENVKEINNGEIRCTLGIPTESTESFATMRLIVAKPPSPPQLEIQKQYDQSWAYKVGDNLRAVCTIRDGRPVANITWLLDEEPVSSHFLTTPSVISNGQNDLETIYQNFSKELRPSDNGRSLKCVANHVALTGNNIASRLLNVTYSPLPQTNPIDKFGYILGQDGVISVEIEANPRPHLEWHVRDQVIKEGGHDNTGRIKAEFIQDLGRGHYEASLIIADINKQDTEVQYILTAYNEQGSQDYMILISTSAEPEDLELGVPSIIGIVIAILILLLIIFLIVFAQVTGRWCFSGKHRNELRHTGESSDTESVDVRQPAKKPIKLMALFKRKPKQEDDERPKSVETVETKLPEDPDKPSEKEGIVYAELDLVQPNLKCIVKNDEDKTEYAEIMYAQKDGDDKNGKESSDDKNNKSAAAS